MRFNLINQYNSRQMKIKCPLHLILHPHYDIHNDIQHSLIAAGQSIKTKSLLALLQNKKFKCILIKH